MCELIAPLTSEDATRVEQTYRTLFTHLDPAHVTLVGNPVITYHVHKRGGAVVPRDLDDLDIILSELAHLPPSISEDFLISHFHNHPNNPAHRNRFYVVLVNPDTKIKIDVFDRLPYTVDEADTITFGELTLQMRNLEDQLVTSVLEASRILTGLKQENKKMTDIDAMNAVADHDRAERLWHKKEINEHERTLQETLTLTKIHTTAHPDLLYNKDRSTMKPYDCEVCTTHPDFPITPMDEIYNILEWGKETS